jgi:isochorismate hydrolase
MRNDNYLSADKTGVKAEKWLQAVKAATAPRPQFVLEPDDCALLVIDMLRYFADPAERCYLPITAAITPAIVSLLTAWRSRGGTVIYTRHCHSGPEDLGLMGKFYSDYIRAGRPEAEIITALAPQKSELIVSKQTYDAFIGTALEAELTKRSIKQVLITGILTHMCCESTARSAFCRGFEVYLPVDALASNREARHVEALIAMADCIASVTHTREVLEKCAMNKS